MIVDLNNSKYANMDEFTATHAMADEITQLTAMRTNLKREVRSYEVSLWTLQDEFITVLKWSDAEQRGRIENPQMKLNIDGTQEFTFSIPMYLYVEEFDEKEQHIRRMIKQENPIWYNTKNGNLMVGMRKIKVIFNKGTVDEAVFEFLITKVTESHEDEQLICEIETEGLAFHELGKIGYKISLSQDTYILDKKDWDEWQPTGEEVDRYWTKKDGTKCYEEPIENVQYWCEQCGLEKAPQNGILNPTKWYYDIQMNWGSFDTIARERDIVYENEYVSSWTSNLQPNTIESAREKARPISVSESNIYNITQTIAEIFEIYCRYEYEYDDNYHIISKKIIFYNNYMNEDNTIDFTYPYNSNKVTREMDSTEIVTKMYVRPQDNDAVVSGKISIEDCPANKTKEDYLLNFDYMYSVGAITKEQYDATSQFEKDVRALNIELDELNLELNAYQKEQIEKSALAKVYEEAKDLDKEQIDYNSGLFNKLTQEGNGYIIRGSVNPYSTYIKRNSNGDYYIKFSDEDKGIDPDTVMIFRIYNSAKQIFKNQIPNNHYTITTDDDGFAKEIILNNQFNTNFEISPTEISVSASTSTPPPHWITSTTTTDATPIASDSLLVYLVYKYEPVLYYEKVNQVWLKKQKQDEDNYLSTIIELGPKSLDDNDYNFIAVYPHYAAELDNIAHSDYDDATAEEIELVKQAAYNNGINKNINVLNTTITGKIAEKNKLIEKFTHMMGPALREGYWQPESYNDYGDIFNIGELVLSSYNSNILIEGIGSGVVIGWDKELFDTEDKIYYEEGILKEKTFYPCIKLDNTLLSKVAKWLRAGQKPSLIFNNNYYKTLTNEEINKRQNLEIFTLGGSLRLGFINNNTSTVVPVLVVCGTEKMNDDEIIFMIKSDKGNPRLGVVLTEIDQNETAVTTFSDDTTALSASNFYWYNNKVSNVISISNFYDVYPRLKISSNELNTTSIVLKYNNALLDNYIDYELSSRTTVRDNKAYFEYFITIKPDVLFRTGSYSNEFEITYTLSNAATCIYLDAQEVMKDSSKPKVEYTVEVNALNEGYLRTLYKNLAQLVKINDTELKFENVFGYISGLDLNLDAPWEDTIEVKNYKTKFEDLFSTIVAQTDSMKKNQEGLFAAANGRVSLTPVALEATFSNNHSLFQNYIDNLFNSSEDIKSKLAELFTEAGVILGAANNSLLSAYDLNIRNMDILAGFVENVTADLTPNIVTSDTQPTDYKVGDVWNETDEHGNIIGRYIAMANSSDAASGYTRTFDGSLASIRGANMAYDAVAGTVDIFGEHEITLRSGKHVYIGAGDSVDIVGNRAVNIGGATINIAAGDSSDLNGGYTTGGINLVSSNSNIDFNSSDANIETAIRNAINNDTNGQGGIISKVLIHPEEITMAAAKLTMKSASIIDMIASTGQGVAGTSAITIDADEGIWIGSGKTISLSSESQPGIGASVNITPIQLFMGVTRGNAAAAIDIEPGYIVLASGTYENLSTNDVTVKETVGNVNSLVGLKLTDSSFGLAIGSGSTRAVMLMNRNGVIVGTGSDPQGTAGTYVQITGTGVAIGSGGTFTATTNNFKVNPSPSDGENYFYVGDSGNSPSSYVRYVYSTSGNYLEIKGKLTANTLSVGSGNNSMTYDGSTLTISGKITATTLSITNGATIGGLTQISGWQIGENKLYSGQGTNYVALNSKSDESYAIWCGNETASSGKFRVTRSGSVYINQLMVKDTKNSNDQWEINPSGTHDAQGYTPIDFSNLNFKQAIALSLQCSGTSISSTANFWGHFNTSLSRSASATCSAAAASSQNAFGAGYTNISIDCGAAGSLAFNNVYVDCSTIATNAASGVISSVNTTADGCGYDNGEVKYITSVTMTNAGSYTVTTDTYDTSMSYKQGYNQAIHDATLVIRYTIVDPSTTGVTHYDKDGRTLGAGWCRVSQSNAYSLPSLYPI